jgi:hypothetical protein
VRVEGRGVSSAWRAWDRAYFLSGEIMFASLLFFFFLIHAEGGWRHVQRISVRTLVSQSNVRTLAVPER